MNVTVESSRELRSREQLYTNLFALERLAAFADGEAAPPLVLSGLTDAAREMLNEPEGQGAAATWLKVFGPTLTLLRQFRNQDVHGSEHADVDDLLQALEASETALTAAVERFNFLADL